LLDPFWRLKPLGDFLPASALETFPISWTPAEPSDGDRERTALALGFLPLIPNLKLHSALPHIDVLRDVHRHPFGRTTLLPAFHKNQF